ncbi:MAG: pyridoxal-phosphate dependent enzyme, partial [Verrucomicrobiota bacterium]
GNAGNITAYWKGFREYQAAGMSDTLPRLMGWQAAGAAPLVLGHPIPNPETVATAIRIGNPASWQGAVEAARDSQGAIRAVTDDEILHAYKLLARTEGIMVEPACAAPLAGLIQCVAAGEIPAGSLVTATMTGHGLKDPDTAIRVAGFEPTVVAPTREAVMAAVGL